MLKDGKRKKREAPRGEPRGNLLRRSSLGYAGRVFAEPCEARNAIPPCGKPQGFLAKKGDEQDATLGRDGQPVRPKQTAGLAVQPYPKLTRRAST